MPHQVLDSLFRELIYPNLTMTIGTVHPIAPRIFIVLLPLGMASTLNLTWRLGYNSDMFLTVE